jgi:hypothetical protein
MPVPSIVLSFKHRGVLIAIAIAVSLLTSLAFADA